MVTINMEGLKGLGKTLLNAVHGFINWFDASDTIGEWTKSHSDKEILELTNKLQAMRTGRSNKLDNLYAKLQVLKDYGINIPVPNNVANALREKQEKLQQEYNKLTTQNALADDASNKLLEKYEERGHLGDLIDKPAKNEDMYKEVINNVQKEFNEERL